MRKIVLCLIIITLVTGFIHAQSIEAPGRSHKFQLAPHGMRISPGNATTEIGMSSRALPIFLVMGITGAICIPTGLACIALGVITMDIAVTDTDHTNGLASTISGGILFILGLPLCIVGFVLFGVFRKRMAQKFNREVNLIASYDNETKMQSLGMSIKL